MTTLNVFNIME